MGKQNDVKFKHVLGFGAAYGAARSLVVKGGIE